jgi:aromatic ring-opening dioxygenase LigB subunit
MKPKKATPKPEDKRDEQIKALKAENAELKTIIARIDKNNTQLVKANRAGSKQLGEMSQDILDFNESLSNLFVRTQRVIQRYNIGLSVTIAKGFPSADKCINEDDSSN